jgi:hypothetical protein
MVLRESRVCERKFVLSTSSVAAREKSGLFKRSPHKPARALTVLSRQLRKAGSTQFRKLRRAQNLSSSLNTSGMQSAAFQVNLFHAIDCDNHEKARPLDPDGCCSKVNARSVNSHDPKNPCLALRGPRRKILFACATVAKHFRHIHTPRRKRLERGRTSSPEYNREKLQTGSALQHAGSGIEKIAYTLSAR